MKKIITISSLLLGVVFLSGCGQKSENQTQSEAIIAETKDMDKNFECGGKVEDADGNSYDTISIGVQCWMASNLNIGKKIDGTKEQVDDEMVEKWCRDNSDANCVSDGGLYTWSEANALSNSCNANACNTASPNQGICPSGWHIPTDKEFMVMEEYLGMCSGNNEGCSGAYGWRGTDQGLKFLLTTLNGNNTNGFSAQLVGERFIDGSFQFYGKGTSFWSASQSSSLASQRSGLTAWRRFLHADATINRNDPVKTHGSSLRCIKD